MTSRQQGGPERRKAKRVKVNFIIKYRAHKPPTVIIASDEDEQHGLLLDLGVLGIAFSTPRKIPDATSLSIKLTLIDYKTKDKDDRFKMREVEGKVRYQVRQEDGRYRTGVSFTGLSQETREIIADFVKKVGDSQ